MNELKVEGVVVEGVGEVIRSESLIEKLAREDDGDQGGIEKVINESVVAVEDVQIEKHKIGDIVTEEVESNVTKSIADEGVQLELKISEKPGFNPNKVQDVTKSEEDDDGGIVANKMAVPQDAEGSQFTPPGDNSYEETAADKYEITGFSIQYTPLGGKGIASEEVRDYYNTIEDAKYRVTNGKYLKPDGNLSRISRGAPIICFNDRQKLEYINEEWRKC